MKKLKKGDTITYTYTVKKDEYLPSLLPKWLIKALLKYKGLNEIANRIN